MAKKQTKAATAVSNKDVHALSMELTGAIYAIQGLLGGADAIKEQIFERVQENEKLDDNWLTHRLLQMGHCLKAVDVRLSELNERTELALTRIATGEPIGETELVD